MLTDISGNREWIEHGTNGLLSPISDHHALARQITFAINEFTDWIDFREKNVFLMKHKAMW
jgi:hypothetical protein